MSKKTTKFSLGSRPSPTRGEGIKEWNKKTILIVVFSLLIPHIFLIIYFYYIGLKMLSFILTVAGCVLLFGWLFAIWVSKQEDS